MEVCAEAASVCSFKKVFVKISQNSQEDTCARVSFLIKSEASACNFVKNEAQAQVFFCKFYEIFKNTFFIEHLRVTASVCACQFISFTVL